MPCHLNPDNGNIVQRKARKFGPREERPAAPLSPQGLGSSDTR